jgi:uncharacterized Zn-binding protein involved in type VI secretion
MGKPLVVVGDKTSHGSITVIVSGDPALLIDGQPAACHGHKTACGATLIASQNATLD